MNEQNKDETVERINPDRPVIMSNEHIWKMMRDKARSLTNVEYPDTVHSTIRAGLSIFDLMYAFPQITLTKDDSETVIGSSDKSYLVNSIETLRSWVQILYNQSDTDELTVGFPYSEYCSYLTINNNLVVYSHSGSLMFFTNMMKAANILFKMNCPYTVMNIKTDGTIIDFIHCYKPGDVRFLMNKKGTHSYTNKSNKLISYSDLPSIDVDGDVVDLMGRDLNYIKQSINYIIDIGWVPSVFIFKINLKPIEFMDLLCSIHEHSNVWLKYTNENGIDNICIYKSMKKGE